MSEPLLIDAGPSKRGWSYYSSFFACPRLFAYRSRLKLQLGSARPLTRGSMLHTMLAHQYARWGARQPGGCWVGIAGDEVVHITDPDQLYEPERALDVWIDRQVDQGREVEEEDAGRVANCFRGWLAEHPEPGCEVLWVEVQTAGVVGYKGEGDAAEFGLWVVDGERGALVAPDGQKVEPTLLDGEPVTITRRFDLVHRRAGHSYVCDHKGTGVFEPGRARDAYAMDGGMASQRILAAQVFPDFRGLELHIVHTLPPFRSARVTPAPTKFRDEQFAHQLLMAAQRIADLDASGLDPWYWPMTQMETGTCYNRYGACGGHGLCSFGPAALE